MSLRYFCDAKGCNAMITLPDAFAIYISRANNSKHPNAAPLLHLCATCAESVFEAEVLPTKVSERAKPEAGE